MSAFTPEYRAQLRSVVAWSAAAPVLGLWPIMSFLPAFAVTNGGLPWWGYAVELAFLASSALVLGVLAAFAAFARAPSPADAPIAPTRRLALPVAVYAAGWTVLYSVYAWAVS